MAKSPAFVLSDALDLKLDDKTLSIEHSGDITLQQTLGRNLGTVRSGGDLTVELPTITGTLVAAGTLRLKGDVSCVKIEAARIIIDSASVTAKVISAGESIAIGGAVLQVDAILAPSIELDRNASGRVKVIQSDNERPANKIKGGFSLADYEDMFGDSEAFLSMLGVEAPTPGEPKSAPPALVEEEDLAEVELTPTPSQRKDEETEEVDDPLSISLDDLEPIPDAGSADDEVRVRLKDALDRITACYEGKDMPPAVSELRALVEDADMDALSANITSVWNGLLGFHQKRGIRPHHQVTHAFNVIHSLVS